MAKKIASKEVQRRLVGMQVLAGGRTPPQAYPIYDVTYLEGDRYVSKMEKGRAIHSNPTFDDINPIGTKAQRAKRAKYFRPDLQTTMLAAALLLKELENACIYAGEPEGDK